MRTERPPRMRAAATLARELGGSTLPKALADSGYRSEQPVILVLESDTLAEATLRVRTYAPPVLLAVYYPGEDRLEFITVTPGSIEAAAADDCSVSPETTVGMLVDYSRVKPSFTFQMTSWEYPLTAVGRPLAEA